MHSFSGINHVSNEYTVQVLDILWQHRIDKNERSSEYKIHHRARKQCTSKLLEIRSSILRANLSALIHNWPDKNGCHLQDEMKEQHFLSAYEERQVFRHYEYVLKDFCAQFQPPMPKYVLVSVGNCFVLNGASIRKVSQCDSLLIKLLHRFQFELCCCFQGTAVMYLKRFYLHNSVMDYHPKDIL